MFTKQAKNLFNYCEKSFGILLDLIRFENGKYQIIDLNKIIGNENRTRFSSIAPLSPKQLNIDLKLPQSTAMKSKTKHRQNMLHQSVDASVGYTKLCKMPHLSNESRDSSLKKIKEEFESKFNDCFTKKESRLRNFFKVDKHDSPNNSILHDYLKLQQNNPQVHKAVKNAKIRYTLFLLLLFFKLITVLL